MSMVFFALYAQPIDRADGAPAVSAAPVPLADVFVRDVRPRLSVPTEEAIGYAARLHHALDAHAIAVQFAQFVLLVDRNPRVQAALLYWGSSVAGWVLVGAAPVSTGLPGRYEHFLTPLGVFEHNMTNPDFRAEGTFNKLGIRGYGRKGSRIYDFGWVHAPKGWGDHAMSVMRLQMHSTDPDVLERRLGTAQSKGCIRIPATLNEFLDRHGVLDADYDHRLSAGSRPWVLRDDRISTPSAGRWLIVIDSARTSRPTWSPVPELR